MQHMMQDAILDCFEGILFGAENFGNQRVSSIVRVKGHEAGRPPKQSTS